MKDRTKIKKSVSAIEEDSENEARRDFSVEEVLERAEADGDFCNKLLTKIGRHGKSNLQVVATQQMPSLMNLSKESVLKYEANARTWLATHNSRLSRAILRGA